MKEEAINSDIVKRYFQALDILKQSGKITGLTGFCEDYGIDRRNLVRIEKEPQRKFNLYFIYILVNDFNINANWLITGTGKMFS